MALRIYIFLLHEVLIVFLKFHQLASWEIKMRVFGLSIVTYTNDTDAISQDDCIAKK